MSKSFFAIALCTSLLGVVPSTAGAWEMTSADIVIDHGFKLHDELHLGTLDRLLGPRYALEHICLHEPEGPGTLEKWKICIPVIVARHDRPLLADHPQGLVIPTDHIPAPVPEPASAFFVGAGVVIVEWSRRRPRRV